MFTDAFLSSCHVAGTDCELAHFAIIDNLKQKNLSHGNMRVQYRDDVKS